MAKQSPMDQLMAALSAAKLNMERGVVENYVYSELGWSDDDLSADAIQEIVEAIANSTAKASKAKESSAIAKSEAKQVSRSTQPDQIPDDAVAILANAVAASDAEVGAFDEELAIGAEEYATYRAQSSLAIIRNIPHRYVHLLGEMSAQEEADPEKFRSMGRQVFAGYRR